MKNKTLLVPGLLLFTLALFTANNVYAKWAVTDNAEPFGVRVTLGTMPNVVTFHLPDANDVNCEDFITSSVDVPYGETISSEQVPDTSDFLSFTFINWFTDSDFTNPVNLNTYVVSSDVDLYAKFQRTNVLKDNTNNLYYVDDSVDQIVSNQYLYKVGTQVWSKSPSVSESNKIDLLTSSGVYKFNYSNSDWSIKRKVAVNCSEVSWWGNDGARTYVYGQTSDTSGWGKRAWGSALSSPYMGIGTSYNSYTSNKGISYIDYTKSYLGIVRAGNSDSINTSNDNSYTGNGIYNGNTSKCIGLSGYNKDEICLYLWGDYNSTSGAGISWGVY